jgi:hypothetical protein
LSYIIEVLASLLSFKTHSKNTSKSDNTIFYMARKGFIFLSFHVYKKFHETRDIPIIFPEFMNIAMYL